VQPCEVVRQHLVPPHVGGGGGDGRGAREFRAGQRRIRPDLGRPRPARVAFRPAVERVRGNRQDTGGRQHQATHPLWCGQGEALGQQSAVGEPEHVDAVDVECVEQCHEVTDCGVGGVVTIVEALGGTAAAAQVGQQQAAPVGQFRQRLAQIGVVPVGPAVDHQERPVRGAGRPRDEQAHGRIGRHHHGAFHQHTASLPHRCPRANGRSSAIFSRAKMEHASKRFSYCYG
jgi:hypothetical protein